jgi:hypothetical protein
MKHYLMVTESDFQKATQKATQSVTQKATLYPSVGYSKKPQETKEALAGQELIQDITGGCYLLLPPQVAATGFEPVTRGL